MHALSYFISWHLLCELTLQPISIRLVTFLSIWAHSNIVSPAATSQVTRWYFIVFTSYITIICCFIIHDCLSRPVLLYRISHFLDCIYIKIYKYIYIIYIYIYTYAMCTAITCQLFNGIVVLVWCLVDCLSCISFVKRPALESSAMLAMCNSIWILLEFVIITDLNIIL